MFREVVSYPAKWPATQYLRPALPLPARLATRFLLSPANLTREGKNLIAREGSTVQDKDEEMHIIMS
jgi:hypothetical protein